ncbi:MAG: rubredoxin-like domain-containing protein [Flavonifractor plautii]
MIAGIEKTHGDRFGKFAELLEQDKLFVSDVQVKWMCLNCGQIIDATMAPAVCPVCKHPQGYFIRWEMAPLRDNCKTPATQALLPPVGVRWGPGYTMAK